MNGVRRPPFTSASHSSDRQRHHPRLHDPLRRGLSGLFRRSGRLLRPLWLRRGGGPRAGRGGDRGGAGRRKGLLRPARRGQARLSPAGHRRRARLHPLRRRGGQGRGGRGPEGVLARRPRAARGTPLSQIHARQRLAVGSPDLPRPRLRHVPGAGRPGRQAAAGHRPVSETPRRLLRRQGGAGEFRPAPAALSAGARRCAGRAIM